MSYENLLPFLTIKEIVIWDLFYCQHKIQHSPTRLHFCGNHKLFLGLWRTCSPKIPGTNSKACLQRDDIFQFSQHKGKYIFRHHKNFAEQNYLIIQSFVHFFCRKTQNDLKMNLVIMYLTIKCLIFQILVKSFLLDLDMVLATLCGGGVCYIISVVLIFITICQKYPTKCFILVEAIVTFLGGKKHCGCIHFYFQRKRKCFFLYMKTRENSICFVVWILFYEKNVFFLIYYVTH